MQQASVLTGTDAQTAARTKEAVDKDWQAVADRQRGEIEKQAQTITALRADLRAEHELAVEHIRRWEMCARAFTREMDLRMQFETRLEETQVEFAELRASAELAITRWKRSEAIRKAAIDNICEQGLVIERLERHIAFLRPLLARLVARWREAKAENAILRTALQTIRSDYGHVCEKFDRCHHVACRDSFAAWHVANEALDARGSGGGR